VVASSGTALTPDQIRLIKRFTPNITILYDSDPAGIKASIRGIDLILEEGLNVKVVLMPDGEDPDSFAHKHSATQVLEYVTDHETDFISFKANLLLKEAKNDPVQKANLIRDIVRSIAVIPESITRSVYIKECTRILNVDEAVLYSEVAKQRREKMEKILGKAQLGNYEREALQAKETPALPSFIDKIYCEEQEKEILSILLKYGSETFFEIPNPDDHENIERVTVGQHIISEILSDDLEFKNLVYKKVFDEYIKLLEIDSEIDNRFFINHADSQVSQLAVNLISDKYKLSNIWKKHHNLPPEEKDLLPITVPKAILVYKSKVMQMVARKLHDDMKTLDPKSQPDDVNNLLIRLKTINEVKAQISKELDRIVL